MPPTIIALAVSPDHAFSKAPAQSITLLQGLGVEGDAHCGPTVKHRSRVAIDPTRSNLRQVHLIDAELLDALNAQGFDIAPGQLGENVTTRGIELLALPTGTRLRLGPQAVVEITGLRNPCAQIEQFRKGALAAVLDRDAAGRLIRKAGVMGIVVAGGVVGTGDAIGIDLPDGERRPLEPV